MSHKEHLTTMSSTILSFVSGVLHGEELLFYSCLEISDGLDYIFFNFDVHAREHSNLLNRCHQKSILCMSYHST